MIVTDLATASLAGKISFLKPANRVEFFQAIRQLTHYALVFPRTSGLLFDSSTCAGDQDSEDDAQSPTGEKCAKYASHVDNLSLMLPEWSLKPIPEDHFFDIVFESSWYLLVTGDMARCEEVSHFAESLCDPSSTQGQIDLSYIYNSYGIIGFQHGKIEESLNWFEKARKLRVDNLAPTDENIAHVEMYMCFVLRALRRYEDTLVHLDQLAERVKKIPNATMRLRAGVAGQRDTVCTAL
ncbi:hypothetical protein QQZ08_003542 [Neonectria magnoliae]|uniref:Uncharacterized protein n=1 Tax=Neonectria magnoliae TaxID=2732573 RepID=A0ABR1IA81_9HYPO